ncbi:hypothetical protein ATERTT37_007033 [Aspergillus terreus]
MTPSSVHQPSQFPGIKVPDGRDEGLCGFRRGDKKVGTNGRREVEETRKKVGEFIDGGKKQRVQRGSQLMSPFLREGALIVTKGNLVGGLERLKELIWLEEGGEGEGVEETEGEEEEEEGE